MKAEVKRLDFIPNIENFLDEFFTLDMYEAGDRMQFYTLDLDNGDTIRIHLSSDESLIENGIPLVSIVAQDNIHFLEWDYVYSDINIETDSFAYYPHKNGFTKEPWDKLINNE